MFDRQQSIPLPICDTYTNQDEEVELLWDSVDYLNDDGDIIQLVIYLNEDDCLQAIEENVFYGNYTKEVDPTPDLYGPNHF